MKPCFRLRRALPYPTLDLFLPFGFVSLLLALLYSSRCAPHCVAQLVTSQQSTKGKPSPLCQSKDHELESLGLEEASSKTPICSLPRPAPSAGSWLWRVPVVDDWCPSKHAVVHTVPALLVVILLLLLLLLHCCALTLWRRTISPHASIILAPHTSPASLFPTSLLSTSLQGAVYSSHSTIFESTHTDATFAGISSVALYLILSLRVHVHWSSSVCPKITQLASSIWIRVCFPDHYHLTFRFLIAVSCSLRGKRALHCCHIHHVWA